MKYGCCPRYEELYTKNKSEKTSKASMVEEKKGVTTSVQGW